MSKEREGAGGRGSLTGKPISKMSAEEMAELSKPIIFGNHQKLFKLFNWAVGAGIVYYMMFHHNFGDKEHCFTKIRKWRERKIKAFFHVDKHDEDVQRLKQQRADSKESSEPAR